MSDACGAFERLYVNVTNCSGLTSINVVDETGLYFSN